MDVLQVAVIRFDVKGAWIQVSTVDSAEKLSIKLERETLTPVN